MLRNDIEQEEQFIKDLESPILRGLARAMLARPEVVKLISRIAGEQLTPEQFERFKEQMPVQIERGRQRQTEKDQSRGLGTKEAL